MVKENELAILFADVVGSTQLYDALGDERARETIGVCIELMRQATEQNNGAVIKTMGDEVMATFPTPDDAMNAAAVMQRTVLESAELTVGGVQVTIRIGCHFGPVVVENRDIFGASVHTANRMVSQAKGGQILTTSAMVNRLSPEWRAAVRQIDVAQVSGRGGEMAMFEVLWQDDDVTSMVPSLRLEVISGGGPGRLILDYEDQEIILDETNSRAILGRADAADLVVKGNLISRIHGRIELQKSHFELVDQSTNGTFVTLDDGKERLVRRDSLQLEGEGLISLGKKASANAGGIIRFRLERLQNPPVDAD